jgi:hypothetical protein
MTRTRFEYSCVELFVVDLHAVSYFTPKRRAEKRAKTSRRETKLTAKIPFEASTRIGKSAASVEVDCPLAAAIIA